MFQKEIVDGEGLHVCNFCNKRIDNFEDVCKHIVIYLLIFIEIVEYHHKVLLKLRKYLNEEEEREIDDCNCKPGIEVYG